MELWEKWNGAQREGTSVSKMQRRDICKYRPRKELVKNISNKNAS